MMIVSFILFCIPSTMSIIVLVKIRAFPFIGVLIFFSIIELITLICGGFRDPGILPRQEEEKLFYRKKKEFKVICNGAINKYVYCYTCGIFRPPRTSHCAKCDNCCLRFDHHCIWLGNCVGKRNYKFFYLLVTTLNVNAFLIIIYDIIIIVKSVKDNNEKKIELNILNISLLAASTLYSLMFVIFFLGKLYILHTKLVLNNITFYEDFKKKLENPAGDNPFYKSISQHIYRLIFKFSFQSFLCLKKETEEKPKTNHSK